MRLACATGEVLLEDATARIIAHLSFARLVAARSLDPRCRGVNRDDLIAWGVLGLVQAAQRYRGDLSGSFAAYAAQRVRGQVLDALRERDPLTRTARRAYREARARGDDLPPPYIEVSLDRLAALGHAPLPSTPAVDAERCRATRDKRWSRVARELRRLPAQERRVLVLSFGRGLTLREIGREVGLSESGVCRVRTRALQRVRERCAA